MHRNFFSIHAVIEMVFELFSSNNIITPDYRTALHVAIVFGFIESTSWAMFFFVRSDDTYNREFLACELCISRFDQIIIEFST